MLLAICDALNTLFCLLGFDITIFSYIGGISFLTLAFLYLVSYVFGFCIYHRMFLHYILVNNIISALEFTVGLPVSFLTLCCIFSINFCVFLFLILYFRKKECYRQLRENCCGQLMTLTQAIPISTKKNKWRLPSFFRSSISGTSS